MVEDTKRLVLAIALVAVTPACRGISDDGAAAGAGDEGAARVLTGPAQDRTIHVDVDGGVGPASPVTLVELPWGSTGRAAGKLAGDESSPMGPMSFAVTAGGRIALLDQVNGRVLFIDPGSGAVEAVPIPSRTFDDVLVTRDGEIVLLDRLVGSKVVVLDPSGDVRAEVAVVGPGIPRGGEVTAMIGYEDGVWLERRHSTMVRVLDEKLEPCEREVVAGRKAGGQARLVASLVEPGVGLVLEGSPDGPARVVLELGHDVSRLVWAEVDGAGCIHAILHLVDRDAGQPARPVFERVVGVRLGPDLDVEAVLSSPYAITELEQFKEFEVTPAGEVYQMAFLDEGVAILFWGAP